MVKQIKGTRKVGIYGNHLVMSAIGASLQGKPDFEVQKIEGLVTDIIGKSDTAAHDVIIFDLAATQPQFAISLIHTHPMIVLIGVDLVNNKMLVLSARQSRPLTEENLVQAIEAGASI